MALFGAGIAKALGREGSKMSIITSVILAVLSLFYIFTLGSFFKANVFVLLNRTTYDTFFELFLFNKSLDHTIIVLSVVVWLALSLRKRPMFVMFAILGILTAVSYTHLTLPTILRV